MPITLVRIKHWCYLNHGPLIDVLLEVVHLALDGVSLQSLQDLLWGDEAVLGLQQGQVDLLRLQDRDHLISGLQPERIGDFGQIQLDKL